MYQSIPNAPGETANGGNKVEDTKCRKCTKDNVILLLVITAVIAVLVGALLDQTLLKGKSTHRLRVKTSSKYTNVQALSLDLYTGPAPVYLKKNASNPECKSMKTVGTVGSDKIPECYMGKADLVDDVDRRIAIIRQALDAAYEMSDKKDTTLKVFLVPEFYFRGPYGAYEIQTGPVDKDGFDSYSPITRIRESLEKIVEQAKYKDWFFVFGTVVAVDQAFDHDATDNKRQYINVALMYKGFDPTVKGSSPIGHRFIAPKTYVSKIDFLSANRDRGSTITADPDDFGHDLFDSRAMLTKVWDRIQAVHYEVIAHHWFEVDGILTSIEICLDHRMGMAIRSFLNYGLQRKEIPEADTDKSKITYGKMTGLAQLSLIVSAGMTIQAQNLVLRQGGLVFIADGDDGEDTAWKRVAGTEPFLSEYKHLESFPNASYPWGHKKPYFAPEMSGVFSEERMPPRVLDYGSYALAP